MRALVSGAAVLALCMACVACGPRSSRPRSDSVPWASSGIDWSRPPEPGTPPPWTPPPIHEARLSSGIRVLLVENHRLPLVALSAVHMRAGAREDGATPGLAALTADIIDDGSEIETTVATDYAAQQLVLPASRLAPSIEMLAEVIRRPRLLDADIARWRAERISALTQRRANPRTVAAQIFDRVVFGAHPYATPAEGTPEDVAAIADAHVRSFWQRSYQPSTLTIVLAGDVTLASAQPLLERAFGGWTAAASTHAAQLPPPLTHRAPQLAYVDTRGATDAVVLVGRLTQIVEAEQLTADVANAIVGGGTGGRLDRVLHAELGYTFGASASFWRGEAAGSWAAAATFRSDVAAKGIRRMLELVETARSTEPSRVEIDLARANLRRGNAALFETTTGTVRALERLVARGRSLEYHASLDARLETILPAAVRASVAAHLIDLSIVVVGDWSKLGTALTSLGLPVVPYTADGKRVP